MSEPGPPGFTPTPPWWVDPTENVKALVEAERLRQDDLRDMQRRHDHELREADTRRQDEKAELRAAHYLEMRKAEADRIDAIRLVDVGAVQRAAEVQATQAQTLATQVSTTADAFRASLAAALAPIQASIEDLRRAQYEAQGQRTQVIDTRQGGQYQLAILGAVIGVAAIIVTILLATGH